MPFINHLKLGKQAAKRDPRTFRLAKYIKALAPPPVRMGYSDKIWFWPLLLNDSLGDCTCAAAAHMIQQWSTYASIPVIPTNDQVLAAYEAVSGYQPGKPWTDQGAVMLDVLNYWRQTGIAGHKILAYAAVDPRNREEIMQAVSLFGNCYIGLALPTVAQDLQVGGNGKPLWAVPRNGLNGSGMPGSWGGHAVAIVGGSIDAMGGVGVEIVTWNKIYDVTWNFLAGYCDEAYCVLSEDWITREGTSPSGFNLAQLQADLAVL